MGHVMPPTSGVAGPGLLEAARPWREFVCGFQSLLADRLAEGELLESGASLLAALVASDDWLPEAFARPHAQHYQQYPLHRDPAGRFSVVSFVWGPGQSTPIHDHTVWGLIGMLRGAEYAQAFRFATPTRLVPSGLPLRLVPGQVERVSPNLGDIHRVQNAYNDRVSISVHVYGADIGTVKRSTYQPDGTRTPFVSGYSAFHA